MWGNGALPLHISFEGAKRNAEGPAGEATIANLLRADQIVAPKKEKKKK